jgi:hypothetical protein
MEHKPSQLTFRDVTTMVEVTHNENRKFLVEALDDALAECTAKAARFQTTAKLMLAVAVQVTGDKVSIAAVIDTKLPRPSPTTASAYVDKAGRLLSEDPRQENLFAIPPSSQKEGDPA